MGTLEAVELGHAREVTRLGHHEMQKHDNAMLGHPDMFWFDTRGVTHGGTWGVTYGDT